MLGVLARPRLFAAARGRESRSRLNVIGLNQTTEVAVQYPLACVFLVANCNETVPILSKCLLHKLSCKVLGLVQEGPSAKTSGQDVEPPVQLIPKLVVRPRVHRVHSENVLVYRG